MELDQFVTQDNAENGIWREVVLYGKVCGFELCILGSDSDAVQKFNRKQMKELRRSSGKQELDDEAVDVVLSLGTEDAVVRIVGIRGKTKGETITLAGKTIGNDRESYLFLINKIPQIKNFVMEVSGNRTNFLPERKKN